MQKLFSDYSVYFVVRFERELNVFDVTVSIFVGQDTNAYGAPYVRLAFKTLKSLPWIYSSDWERESLDF